MLSRFRSNARPTATMHPFGDSGYTLSYPLESRSLLRDLRQTQQEIASNNPGWMTRLDYSAGKCHLHIFPTSELPGALFRRLGQYK